MTEILEAAQRFAEVDWPILITGETGCGKEVLAKRIHSLSSRAKGNFVPVNCAAIPPALFESELFGHERGAFSGAAKAFVGVARTANEGTLFLDEIGDLELALQAKLLRFVENAEVRSVGSERVTKENVRIIAATHIDLARAARQGRFRLDLLERLSVLVLRIPPLRERPNDLLELIQQFSLEMQMRLPPNAILPLQQFPWPGNVRQLKNVLIRAKVLSKDSPNKELLLRLLKQELADLPFAPDAKASLAEIEKQAIVERLRQNGGNRKQTASELGIAKSTLHEKLRRWRLDSIDCGLGLA